MTDAKKRNTDYLRVSLTDRCDLRCRYCMPPQGVELLRHEDILRFEEILRIVRLLCREGLKKVRLTGGEPLVRKGAETLIYELNRIKGLECVALTTNGVLLEKKLPALIEAGLKAVNISLDTLDPMIYRRITGADALDTVCAAIDAAVDSSLTVKINCVPVRELNGDEFYSLARIAAQKPVDVRFIELMPIGCGRAFTGIPTDEILTRLTELYGEPEYLSNTGAGPAVYYRFSGFAGRIGFISPMTHAFCSTCSRLRLTADGRLKLCLARSDYADLRTLLRSGASDDEIMQTVREALARKPAAHGFADENSVTEQRKMVQIGG